MTKTKLVLLAVLGGCSSTAATPDGGGDAAAEKSVVINELFASGLLVTTPDWAELKNVTAAALDVSGFQIRDQKPTHLFALPAGTTIEAGGYLIVYCDNQAEGGVAGGIHAPWKLSSTKGDEFHLLNAAGVELDATVFGVDLPTDRSWGRLPDGTGAFIRTTPTQGQPNL